VAHLQKCDERANEAGHCQTCVRLRLECLGFGAKRPEWLRVRSFLYLAQTITEVLITQESRNVVDLREKIKAFLAAQGMIKGHSGSGPRNAEQEPPMLRLADDYSSSSESPPTPTLSLASHEDHLRHRHPGLTISAIREDQGWASIDPAYTHSGVSAHLEYFVTCIN
jgi:C6 transcription factor Pro1